VYFSTMPSYFHFPFNPEEINAAAWLPKQWPSSRKASNGPFDSMWRGVHSVCGAVGYYALPLLLTRAFPWEVPYQILIRCTEFSHCD
jgi:hypothetical protein